MTSRFAVWLLLGAMLAPAAEAQLLLRRRYRKAVRPVSLRQSPPACGVRFDSFMVTSRLMEPGESLALAVLLPPRVR